MDGEAEDILIPESRIAPATLARLVRRHFGDMVKYVVDVERGVITIGGEGEALPE